MANNARNTCRHIFRLAGCRHHMRAYEVTGADGQELWLLIPYDCSGRAFTFPRVHLTFGLVNELWHRMQQRQEAPRNEHRP